MITDIEQLISLCSTELDIRDYSEDYKTRISHAWDSLVKWMEQNKISNFSESIGNDFCDAKIGAHLSKENFKKSQRIYLRATRMIISYQKEGGLENRAPRIERIYYGIQGEWIKQYLGYLQDIKHLKPSTIMQREKYLYMFYVFLGNNGFDVSNINFDIIEQFHRAQTYYLPSRHNSSSAIRLYLRYLYEVGLIEKDLSICVVKDNYQRLINIPTTYTEEEISKTISMVDRSSAIGKRNYLILLLAAEYGWRSSDIIKFSLDQIDWDKNIIYFRQSKTDVPVEYPLLSSIGNAIIDYLRNGRPMTEAREVILSVKTSRKTKPLSGVAISSIVAQYLEKANIKDWNTKKHGPHSFRHSLASNMLKQGISLPVISSVLGHSSSESTKIYLKVDTDRLKICALPMPAINSPYYQKGGIWL